MPSGEEAFLDVMKNQVDLMVIDYRLPGMNGFQLMQKIRKIKPSVKFMMISGQTDPKIWEEMEAAKPYAIFRKPIDIPEFLEKVIQFLGSEKTTIPTDPGDFMFEYDQELMDIFQDLKVRLKAQSVILMNEQGHILANAGESGRKGKDSLTESFVPIFTSLRKLSQKNDQKIYSSWHIFHGGKFDTLFSPLDAEYALILAGVDKQAEDISYDEIQNIIKSLQLKLDRVEKVEEVNDITRPEVTSSKPEINLEPVVKDIQDKVPTDELNAFWNDAVDKYTVQPSHPEDLTYDQAKKMGLTPGDA
jgi:CheY-like chemotaxis protein